jgi:colanic acid biosynthesis glycosyl transferase WcaI
MRILILTQWYQPEPPKLLSDLAQSLQAKGHSVEVLTGFPNYPSGTLYPGYRLSLWQKEVLDGIP